MNTKFDTMQYLRQTCLDKSFFFSNSLLHAATELRPGRDPCSIMSMHLPSNLDLILRSTHKKCHFNAYPITSGGDKGSINYRGRSIFVLCPFRSAQLHPIRRCPDLDLSLSICRSNLINLGEPGQADISPSGC